MSWTTHIRMQFTFACNSIVSHHSHATLLSESRGHLLPPICFHPFSNAVALQVAAIVFAYLVHKMRVKASTSSAWLDHRKFLSHIRTGLAPHLYADLRAKPPCASILGSARPRKVPRLMQMDW
jgi:hypothetical protein